MAHKLNFVIPLASIVSILIIVTVLFITQIQLPNVWHTIDSSGQSLKIQKYEVVSDKTNQPLTLAKMSNRNMTITV
jgi:hypothetical protein